MMSYRAAMLALPLALAFMAPLHATEVFEVAALDTTSGERLSTPAPAKDDKDGVQMTEWVGAPCVMDEDCTNAGDNSLKCDTASKVCVKK